MSSHRRPRSAWPVLGACSVCALALLLALKPALAEQGSKDESATNNADRSPQVKDAVARQLPGEKPLSPELRRALDELDAPDYWVRRAAARRVWLAGRDAQAALERISADRENRFEAALVADEILDRFRWGIYPDTPKRIIELITAYRAGDQQSRSNVLFALMDMGDKAYPTLLALVTADRGEDGDDDSDGDPFGRRTLRSAVSDETFAAVEKRALDMTRDCIADGRPAVVEKWLRLAALTGRSTAVRNYAAFLYSLGELDAKTSEFTSGRHGPVVRNTAKLAAMLERAAGRPDAALQLARQSGDDSLIWELSYEAGQWDDLYTASVESKDLPTEEGWAYLYAFAHLAGRQKEAADLRGKLAAGADEDSAWYAAEALLVTDAVDEAIAVLKSSNRYLPVFELLQRQQRYSEALAVADEFAAKPQPPKPQDENDDAEKEKPDDRAEALARFELRRARLLHALGRKEQAEKIFDRVLAEGPKNSHLWVIDAEVQLGLRDAALGHAQGGLIAETDFNKQANIVRQLYPKQGARIDLWWRVLCQTRKLPPREALSLLERIMQRPRQTPELPALLEQGETQVLELLGEERSNWYYNLAETAIEGGRLDLAEGILTRAIETTATSKIALKLGDVRRELGQYIPAAEAYRRAYELENEQGAAALYLEGACYELGGKTEKGGKLKTEALLSPLADTTRRYRLGSALSERGFNEDAERQYEIIRRCGTFRSWELGFALRRAAMEAQRRGDFNQARLYYERSMLDVLKQSTAFVEVGAYLTVPYLIHKYELQGRLAADDYEGAVAAARAALRLIPGDIDLPILLASRLDKAGRSADADALVAPCFTFQREQCQAFPESGQRHNQLAWLGARTRRHLDESLKHAQTAVRLVPESSAYLDTLAEVHFQRGERKQAVDLMLKCIEMDPQHAYYRQNIARYTSPLELDAPEEETSPD